MYSCPFMCVSFEINAMMGSLAISLRKWCKSSVCQRDRGFYALSTKRRKEGIFTMSAWGRHPEQD
jgi:hypothetical protein